MKKKIAVILGHPSADADTFCRALAQAYMQGAREGGHEAELIDISGLDIGFLGSRADYNSMPSFVASVQANLARADHWVLIYPLWLGDVPARFKAFLEWVLSPGFAYENVKDGFPRLLLKGKSARVIVTMGMPGFAYRFIFLAHSLKSLERNILKFVGIRPVRHSIIGNVEAMPTNVGQRWLARMTALGRRAR